MALVDYVSYFSNCGVVFKWANGKLGTIVPTANNTYRFEKYINGSEPMYKNEDEKTEENCPTVAYGFVFFWLRYRKRCTRVNRILNACRNLNPTAEDIVTLNPIEIFDRYIKARKDWYIDMMNKQPDAWKYPNLEKLFYKENLTVEDEANKIILSAPILEYIDEEDKNEFKEVMTNFLGYVDSLVKPFQEKENIITSEDTPDDVESSNSDQTIFEKVFVTDKLDTNRNLLNDVKTKIKSCFGNDDGQIKNSGPKNHMLCLYLALKCRRYLRDDVTYIDFTKAIKIINKHFFNGKNRSPEEIAKALVPSAFNNRSKNFDENMNFEGNTSINKYIDLLYKKPNGQTANSMKKLSQSLFVNLA